MSEDQNPAENPASRSSHCYAADDEVLTIQWVDGNCETLIGSMVEVKPVGINRWFDGIEIWQRPSGDDGGDQDRILAISKYPITVGDVRNVCRGLGIQSA